MSKDKKVVDLTIDDLRDIIKEVVKEVVEDEELVKHYPWFCPKDKSGTQAPVTNYYMIQDLTQTNETESTWEIKYTGDTAEDFDGDYTYIVSTKNEKDYYEEEIQRWKRLGKDKGFTDPDDVFNGVFAPVCSAYGIQEDYDQKIRDYYWKNKDK
jgi:hypothetical protein